MTPVVSDTNNRGQKAQSSSPSPKSQTQTDGRKPSKGIAPRGESPSGGEGWNACKNIFKGKCTDPSCDLWHPPVCLDTLRLLGSPLRS